jgi:pyruvate/2-oxoglutarate dehydrogenase complex dihydrolipoamide acyltransferase (E2) component
VYRVALRRGSARCRRPPPPPPSWGAGTRRDRGRRRRQLRLRRPSPPRTWSTSPLPIVGTFYAPRRPTPPNYVKVGDRVQARPVLCIIEAMKLMNEIEAEVAGTSSRCLVERGPGRVRPGAVPDRPELSGRERCSRRSSSPTAARSRCGSCAPPASSASSAWSRTRRPTRPRCPCCSPTRRSASGPHRRRVVPQRPQPALGGHRHRSRGGASRLRLPGRERRVRGEVRGAQPGVHRSASRDDRPHRRQGQRPPPGRGGRRADHARARTLPRPRGRAGVRGRDRVPGHPQGLGRRRRSRHAGGAVRNDLERTS